jgi:hypothetical protein
MIVGTWTQDSDGLHIVGRWTRINGISATNDFREMDIHIGYLKDSPREHLSMHSGKKLKVYECYFLIERVEKIRKEG